MNDARQGSGFGAAPCLVGKQCKRGNIKETGRKALNMRTRPLSRVFPKTATKLCTRAIQDSIRFPPNSIVHRSISSFENYFFMANHIYVADFGGNLWHVHCLATGAFFTFTKEEFFCIVNWLPSGSILIIEKAHMTPRSDYSLAQVYTADELLAFHKAIKDHGCKLRLFPQGLTPKARAEAQLSSKSDQNDLLAIASYVQNHPELKLCKLPETFITERRREAAWTFKQENDGILNVARRFAYQAENDAVIEFLNTHLEELVAQLSPATRSIMMVDDSHRNSRTKQFKKTGAGARNARLYTLLALFLHPKGYARVRPDTGNIPGLSWTCRYVLGMSPFQARRMARMASARARV